jgi:hypothetical protein
MRVINVLAAVAATMLVGGLAAAKDKPADSGEKKVCRTEMPAIGRIPAKRVCRPKAEWDAMSAASQRASVRAVEASTAR